MYFKKFILVFAVLRSGLALTIPTDSTLLHPRPSNVSIPGLHESNHTLRGWPEELPWILRIDRDLSLEFTAYGEDLDRSLDDEVREALEWMLADISTEGNPMGILGRSTYRYDWTYMRVYSRFIRPPIPRAYMLKILIAVKGVYFTYNWGARPFYAKIRLQDRRLESIDLLEINFWVISPLGSHSRRFII